MANEGKRKESFMVSVMPEGIDAFAEIRAGYFYADKSLLLEDLLLPMPKKVTIITRPDHFGKTLTLSMLREFFDIARDSRELFKDLAIAKNAGLCSEWMNAWPVVFLSLKEVVRPTFLQARQKLAATMRNLCRSYAFLGTSEQVNPYDLPHFDALANKKVGQEEVADSLVTLCRMLRDHYGKPVIVLIDAYDVPLTQAARHGYAGQMLDFFRAFLGGVLQGNASVRFCVLAGTLRVAGESLFSQLGSVAYRDILSPRMADKLGFTLQDVDALLRAAGLEGQQGRLQPLCGGYRFGDDQEIWNPRELVHWVALLQDNPDAELDAFWGKEKHSPELQAMLNREDAFLKGELETLLSDGHVWVDARLNFAYIELVGKPEHIWQLFHMKGLVAQVSRKSTEGEERPPHHVALGIPNDGMRAWLIRETDAWFGSSLSCRYRELKDQQFPKMGVNSFFAKA